MNTEEKEEVEEQPIELKRSTAKRIAGRRAYAELDKALMKQNVVAQGTPFEYMEAGQGG